MAPRFCASCGAGLAPTGAFCGACGAAVAGAPQPSLAVAAPAPRPHPPAPPQQPAYGHGDWNSLEVQPGETAQGSWIVALIVNGLADVTGSLTVTDRRILFKPQVAGGTPLVMLASAASGYTERHWLVLRRDQVAGVHSEKGFVNTKVFVTMADGAIHGFVRGLMSADPIVAAIQQR